MSFEIVCMEIQNSELILNDDEGVIHETSELDNGKNTLHLQEDNEEKVFLDPVGVELFIIQDVAASIEDLPPGSGNEEFAEEE